MHESLNYLTFIFFVGSKEHVNLYEGNIIYTRPDILEKTLITR